MNARRLAISAAVVALAAFARTIWTKPKNGVSVTVVNDSAAAMTGARLTMDDGTVEPLGLLPPRSRVSAELHPRGEAGLTLDWAEKKSTAPATTYVEGTGGYAATFTVKADGSLLIETRIGRY